MGLLDENELNEMLFLYNKDFNKVWIFTPLRPFLRLTMSTKRCMGSLLKEQLEQRILKVLWIIFLQVLKLLLNRWQRCQPLKNCKKLEDSSHLLLWIKSPCWRMNLATIFCKEPCLILEWK